MESAEQTPFGKDKDAIFLKIEEIYVSKNKEGKPTGKNLISHLLRAYFPVGKAQRVIDVPEKSMKCIITGQKLFALGEIWNAMQKEEFMKDMMKNMAYRIDPENKEVVENPFDKIANGRLLALTGENTDKYMCQEAYEGLYNWYASKILHGDKHINWLAHDMRKKAIINTVREKLPDAEDQKKIDRAEQILKRPKRATMSLGDMTVLQELQERLKKQEEGEKK